MRIPLQTERLILRDVTEADAERLFELDSDPEVMRYIGPQPASDPAAYRERTRSVYIPWQAHPWHGVRMVHDRATSDFLGWVFIRPATASINARELDWTRDDEVEVGYRYRRCVWGRGIATEAAASLVQIALADPATTAIVACAMKGNEASLRVLEKLGLERVGETTLSESGETLVKLARGKR
jgi:RimJ/RimL family protein N-acetyltransferase